MPRRLDLSCGYSARPKIRMICVWQFVRCFVISKTLMSGTTFPWGWEYVTLGIKERPLKVDRFYSLWAVGIIFIYFLTVGVAWILPSLRHFSVIYSRMARGLGCVCLWNQVDAVLAFELRYLCLFNVFVDIAGYIYYMTSLASYWYVVQIDFDGNGNRLL